MSPNENIYEWNPASCKESKIVDSHISKDKMERISEKVLPGGREKMERISEKVIEKKIHPELMARQKPIVIKNRPGGNIVKPESSKDVPKFGKVGSGVKIRSMHSVGVGNRFTKDSELSNNSGEYSPLKSGHRNIEIDNLPTASPHIAAMSTFDSNDSMSNNSKTNSKKQGLKKSTSISSNTRFIDLSKKSDV